MTPNSIETLTNPQPRGHIVYLYTNESQVVEAVCLFASAGLRKGDAVLLVLTEAHRQLVRQQLDEEGFVLEELESSGRFLCTDAQGLLASFLIDGIIDEYRFKNTIGQMIEAAKESSRNCAVRVFGEMVDLICTSNPKATERLEELWNQVIEAHSVPLLCAYSLSGTRRVLPTPLLACHSHAVA
jgi:hypothetical protein